MIKAVLPGMRARRSGSIVNISSIGATINPEGSGYYAASKAALEGMTGSLRKELAPLGISVTAVEPGAFRTDFAGRSLAQSAAVIDDYAPTAGRRRIEAGTGHGTQQGDPAKAAQALISAVDSPHPPAFLLLAAMPSMRTAASSTPAGPRSTRGRKSASPPVSAAEPRPSPPGSEPAGPSPGLHLRDMPSGCDRAGLAASTIQSPMSPDGSQSCE